MHRPIPPCCGLMFYAKFAYVVCYGLPDMVRPRSYGKCDIAYHSAAADAERAKSNIRGLQRLLTRPPAGREGYRNRPPRPTTINQPTRGTLRSSASVRFRGRVRRNASFGRTTPGGLALRPHADRPTGRGAPNGGAALRRLSDIPTRVE